MYYKSSTPQENKRSLQEPGSIVLVKKNDHYTGLMTARRTRLNVTNIA
jgi:Cys-tRNA synthase (O-phospho-L-seryl-tRNA:Cys-tRNA synthase)